MVARRARPAVERVVDLPIPPEEVWPVVADPTALGEWLDAEVDLEIRPGGRGSFSFPDGSTRRVIVHEADAPARLVFSWWPDDGGRWRLAERTTVTISLEPIPGGTRVRVVEARAPSLRARAAA